MSELDRACTSAVSFHVAPNMHTDEIHVRAKRGELSQGEAPTYVSFGVRMPGAEFTVYLSPEQFGALAQKIQTASLELDAELDSRVAGIDLGASAHDRGGP